MPTKNLFLGGCPFPTASRSPETARKAAQAASFRERGMPLRMIAEKMGCSLIYAVKLVQMGESREPIAANRVTPPPAGFVIV